MKEFDNRGVFDIGCARVIVVRNIFDGNIVKIKIATPRSSQGVHRFAGGFGGSVHQFTQFIVLCNNPIHAHLGSEFYFFRCLLIRGVCGRDDESIISLAKNNYLICIAYFGVE
ncbi:hypothetical protein D3C72_1405550 [compost metagenome]